tara:strand:+ start:596 stop:808 length:213 start_codon:yes stop_codon:yes gene_type:complete
MCCISREEGVSRDMAANNRNLKNKAFLGDGADKHFPTLNKPITSLHLRDCAIDEMVIDYDEFENIKDIGE